MSRFYGTAAWRRLRAEVLRRQPVCATPGCGRPSTIADHIIPRSRGGADTLANLRGLCVACHNQRVRDGRHPRAKGCDANGWPLDHGHWWQAGASRDARKSLGAGGATGGGDELLVSFRSPDRGRGRR